MAGRRLVVVSERNHSYIDIDADEIISVGRAPDNDVVVKDDMVSRRHCQIERASDGKLRVNDLKSFNGTYLNEGRIRDETLNLWDTVRVGRTKLFLVERSEDTPPLKRGEKPQVTETVPEESDESPPEPGPPAEEATDAPGSSDELEATRTIDVGDIFSNKEMREVVDGLIRDKQAEVEKQICRRIRDESGPSVLATMSGFEARVRRIGPADGGGDFYDVFREPLRPNELVLSLGSVSGVSIAACVAATAARHALRGVSSGVEGPRAIVDPLREVLRSTLHPGSALSLLVAELSTRGKLRACALGGVGLLHYNSATDSVEVLRSPGRRDEEAARIDEMEIQLKPGDRALLVSDGAGSLRRGEGDAFGAERLQSKFKELAAEDPKEIVTQLCDAYSSFSGHRPERDVTLVSLAQDDA